MDEGALRTCTKCGESKSLSAFYRNRTKRDGRDVHCKECFNRAVEERRALNPETEYERRRRQQIRHRERLAAKMVAYRQTHKEMCIEQQRMYRQQHPERVRAKAILDAAVRKGKVIRPLGCSNCGDTRPVVGHHADYGRPLDVIWLCQMCHSGVHAGLVSLLGKQEGVA